MPSCTAISLLFSSFPIVRFMHYINNDISPFLWNIISWLPTVTLTVFFQILLPPQMRYILFLYVCQKSPHTDCYKKTCVLNVFSFDRSRNYVD